MIFSSVSFLFYFFPIVLMLYFLSPRKYRNLILFIRLIFLKWSAKLVIFNELGTI